MGTGIVRSIVVMLVGVLLMFWSESVANVFIRLLGVAFFLPALVSIVQVALSKVRNGAFSNVLVSTIDVGSMAFGIWLMIAPASFETLIVRVFAVVSLFLAVFQIVMFFVARRRFALSGWTLLVPFLLIAGGVLLFKSPLRPMKVLSVSFGAVVLLSGILDLVVSLKLWRLAKLSRTEVEVLD